MKIWQPAVRPGPFPLYREISRVPRENRDSSAANDTRCVRLGVERGTWGGLMTLRGFFVRCCKLCQQRRFWLFAFVERGSQHALVGGGEGEQSGETSVGGFFGGERGGGCVNCLSQPGTASALARVKLKFADSPRYEVRSSGRWHVHGAVAGTQSRRVELAFTSSRNWWPISRRPISPFLCPNSLGYIQVSEASQPRQLLCAITLR